GRLVVRAEDRVVPVREQAVVTYDLDRPVQRHGVHVGAEQHRGRALGPGYAGEQVPGVRPRRRRAVVLLDLHPQPAQVLDDGVGDPALAARRALDLAEADELGEQALALLRGHGVDHGTNATARWASPLASSAAPRRPRRG